MVWSSIEERRAYFRNAAKKRVARLIASGLCRNCGGPIDRDGTLCTNCCVKALSYKMKRGLKARELAENGVLECIRCGRATPVSGLAKCGNGVNRFCKKCWNEKNKEQRQRYRREALCHYSNSERPFCACCGDDNYEFLAIDHVDGGGCKHRRKEGYGDLPRWLKSHGWPDGYRVLCHNCNFSRGAYGYCPHERN